MRPFQAFSAAALAVFPAALGAQTYNWRNVEIVGGGYVPGIVFNTSEPDLVYARTDIGGAYRWNPSTGRWVPLLDWIGFDDWNLTGVDSLATDPVDPNRLYVLAGTYTNAWTSPNGAVLRSTDRGATFARTNLPFKSGGNMPGRNMGERLAIDPNRNATLYLGARSGNGLWRSTDFAASWARVTSFPATGTYVQDPNDPNGYLNDSTSVPAGMPVDAVQELPLLVETCGTTPAGAHTTRLALAAAATVPAPLTPPGSLLAWNQFVPPSNEKPARFTLGLAALSTLPTRTMKPGDSSAKSMLCAAKAGVLNIRAGGVVRLSWRKPLMSPSPLMSGAPEGGLTSSSTAVSSRPWAFTSTWICPPVSQASRSSAP